ncbi:Phospholipase/carboxylesterase [Tricholoma matsutake]|nr:Phospholipase/carboxylesterase [Tricholoma matsutake 945]
MIPPQQKHTGTIIVIHGAGESSATWKTIVEEALAPRLPHISWIIPQAPERPVSVHQGQLIPCWFDTVSLPPGLYEFDEAGISESVTLIDGLIQSQMQAGIDSRQIVLMGFSQGAALSMIVALTKHYNLGGVVSLSGWIPLRARHMMRTTSALPIMWCHGTADDVIPLSYAEDALAFLQNSVGIPSLKLKSRLYDSLGHAVQDNELNDIASWFQGILVG